MEQNYLHTFRLRVEGFAEPVEFNMYHELDDIAEVTDAFAKFVARQEDDFLPLGIAAAVRASKIFHLEHVTVMKAAAS